MNHRSTALRESARYAPCALCGAEDGTVVWAHPNSVASGKGFGIKAHDALGAYLCFHCHTTVDQSGKANKAQRQRMMHEAHFISLTRLLDAGWTLEPPSSKPVPKIFKGFSRGG